MLQNIISTTKVLFNKIVFTQSTKIENTKQNSSPNQMNETAIDTDLKPKTNTKDKIYFQPNTITTTDVVNCGITKKSLESQLTEKIIIECSQKTLWQLDKLCRYFEIDQSSAVMRGLWMLHVVQECEIANKKIGVITLDQNNIVVDIAPINIV